MGFMVEYDLKKQLGLFMLNPFTGAGHSFQMEKKQHNTFLAGSRKYIQGKCLMGPTY